MNQKPQQVIQSIKSLGF